MTPDGRDGEGGGESDYYGFSHKLFMWYVEAWKEKSLPKYLIARLFRSTICQDYALYPGRYYRKVGEFDHEKTLDYCFIGGLRTDERTLRHRAWILDFIRERFGERSWLQFTDRETRRGHRSMGPFDHTLDHEGFVPKEHPVRLRNTFDDHYFRTMARSAFTLCPAGDAIWSMRFYEALMCRSIPIVAHPGETFRSRAEAEVDYRFYLASDRHEYREDWAEHNYRIFLRYHTLEDV